MKKIVLVLVGAPVLAIAVVWTWGSCLDERHTVTREARLPHPTDRVWELIVDFPKAPAWRPGVTAVTAEEGDEFCEVNDFGELRYRVEERRPRERLVTRVVDNSDFGGTWTYELTPTPEGCRLTITEAGEIYSPLMRFFGTYVFGLETSVEGYLEAVRAELGS